MNMRRLELELESESKKFSVVITLVLSILWIIVTICRFALPPPSNGGPQIVVWMIHILFSLVIWFTVMGSWREWYLIRKENQLKIIKRVMDS